MLKHVSPRRQKLSQKKEIPQSLLLALVQPIEALEQRILLSIAATTLTGPYDVPGTNWSYQVAVNGNSPSGTLVRTAAGATTFLGQSVFELDDNLGEKSYFGTNAGGDIVNFADVGTAGNGTSSTQAYSPYRLVAPANIVAGTDYPTTWINTTTQVTNGVTTTTREKGTSTLMLTSESTVAVTVPYSSTPLQAYLFSASDTRQELDDSGNPVGTPATTSTQNWVVAGIGLVKLASTSGDSAGSVEYDLTKFNSSGDHLAFVPATIANNQANKAFAPVVVEALDSNNDVDANASGMVTIALNSFSHSGTGTLNGTLSQALSGGVATFTGLSLDKNGGYQLKATDTNNDDPGLSSKFAIGVSSLKLEITTHGAKAKGFAAGDNMFYSVLLSRKLPIQDLDVTLDLPAGLQITSPTGGGTVSAGGNSITWTSPNFRLGTFIVKLPDDKKLSDILGSTTTINSSVVGNVTYADDSTDVATANNSAKLALNYQVKGKLGDVEFQYPNRLTVVTNHGLGGVTVNLKDATGAVLATTKTKGNGTYALLAKKGGDYNLEFVSSASFYDTATNNIAPDVISGIKTVNVPKISTNPVMVDDLAMAKTFFETSAGILKRLNNYATSTFQNSSTFELKLFHFDTTGAESAISVLRNVAVTTADALKAPGDQIGGGIRMMAGLAEVDLRFSDTFKIVDQVGKAFSVLLSAQFSGKVGKSLGKYFPNQTIDQKFQQATRVFLFTATGALLPTSLDLAGVKPSDKSTILATVFVVARYVSDLFNGKAIDDFAFETVFNAIRIAFDAAILTATTDVSLNDDLPAPFSLMLADRELIRSTGLPAVPATMQGVINQCVNIGTQYSADTGEMLTTLNNFEDQLHKAVIWLQYATGVLNASNSFVRGVSGTLALQSAAAGISARNNPLGGPMQLVGFQRSMSKILGQVENGFEGVTKTATKKLQARLVIAVFATGLVNMLTQETATAFVPQLVTTGVDGFGASTVDLTFAVRSPPAPELGGGTEQPAVQRGANSVVPAKAPPASLPVDATTYLSDLSQLAALVKAGDGSGEAAFNPTFQTDDDALFSKDLLVLENQGNAVLPLLDTAGRTAVSELDAAMNQAVSSTMLAELQISGWALAPATGNAAAVITQLTKAQSAVTTAVQLASLVRSAIAGLTIPPTFQIDATTVPTQMNHGDVQTFTFTVTNVGSLPTAAGSVQLSNGDGSLIVQTAAQQVLPPLDPGASTTFTWQVQAVTPTQANLGSVYQVTAIGGNTSASISDGIDIA